MPRLKDSNSLIAKAFWRGKDYGDPWAEITDRVGVRFVVLLTSDLDDIEEIIVSEASWTYDRARDYEQERRDAPLQFAYSAVHFVVFAKADIEVPDPVDGSPVTVPSGTPCEVQVKTLLQHAHSELTHDTVYKPIIKATPEMERATARSMALIESTDDHFLSVAKEFESIIGRQREFTREMATLYERFVGIKPENSSVEQSLTSAYSTFIDDMGVEPVKQFFESRPELGETIGIRSRQSILFMQPSVLLVYYLVRTRSSMMQTLWPFQESELSHVFTDLGVSFSFTQ